MLENRAHQLFVFLVIPLLFFWTDARAATSFKILPSSSRCATNIAALASPNDVDLFKLDIKRNAANFLQEHLNQRTPGEALAILAGALGPQPRLSFIVSVQPVESHPGRLADELLAQASKEELHRLFKFLTEAERSLEVMEEGVSFPRLMTNDELSERDLLLAEAKGASLNPATKRKVVNFLVKFIGHTNQVRQTLLEKAYAADASSIFNSANVESQSSAAFASQLVNHFAANGISVEPLLRAIPGP